MKTILDKPLSEIEVAELLSIQDTPLGVSLVRKLAFERNMMSAHLKSLRLKLEAAKTTEDFDSKDLRLQDSDRFHARGLAEAYGNVLGLLDQILARSV